MSLRHLKISEALTNADRYSDPGVVQPPRDVRTQLSRYVEHDMPLPDTDPGVMIGLDDLLTQAEAISDSPHVTDLERTLARIVQHLAPRAIHYTGQPVLPLASVDAYQLEVAADTLFDTAVRSTESPQDILQFPAHSKVQLPLPDAAL